jgi:hypothetical protein
MKIALALAAAWILSGCSAMRIAYDNADTFLRWRATSYLDVHGDDSDELDAAIDEFLSWHRAQALPKYALLAEDGAKRVAAGLSPGDLVWGFDSLVAQARESVRAAAVRIAPLLDRLSEEQVKHIEKRFAEDNRKFAREFLRGSEKERRKRRENRNVERMEDWVGGLSQQQAERVKQYSERAPIFSEHRDRDRKRLQAEFLSIVRAREAKKRLPDAAANWDLGRDVEYVGANEALFKEFSAMLLDVERMLAPEQRAKAVARLRAFADDFTALSRSGAENRAR